MLTNYYWILCPSKYCNTIRKRPQAITQLALLHLTLRILLISYPFLCYLIFLIPSIVEIKEKANRAIYIKRVQLPQVKEYTTAMDQEN